MKRRLALFLALVSLLTLAACGSAPAQAGADAAPAAGPAEEAAIPAEAAQATAADISLEGLLTGSDAVRHLEAALPLAEGEGLIPYAAAIYHAGDNTATWTLLGFCTPGGRVVTKPIFSWIDLGEMLEADRADGPERFYLAEIAGQPRLCAMISQSGELLGWAGEREGQYRSVPQDGERIESPGWDVCDDGVYYIDGYELYGDPAAGTAYGLIPYSEDGYRICRKSDGTQAAATDWPAILSCDLPEGGRVYFTVQDDFCCSCDGAFHPYLRAPAIKPRQVFCFEDAPEETPAMEPGERVELTAAQQYEANIFLSNFSEQRFCEFRLFDRFDASDTSIAQLFDFAHLWAKINRRSAIGYEGSYETLTREDFIDIVYRYLDLSVFPEPQEGAEYSAELGMGHYDWDRCWYADGRFWYPAADGESFNRFSVVDEAFAYPDNRFRFRFTIYELDIGLYRERDAVPAEYYHLTPAEAAERLNRGEITAVRRGEALCLPCYLESSQRSSYVLQRYSLEDAAP